MEAAFAHTAGYGRYARSVEGLAFAVTAEKGLHARSVEVQAFARMEE